jgi:hypothetical protein
VFCSEKFIVLNVYHPFDIDDTGKEKATDERIDC